MCVYINTFIDIQNIALYTTFIGIILEVNNGYYIILILYGYHCLELQLELQLTDSN